MTDDLEELLTDIDSDTVEKSLREVPKQDGERIAREGDSIPEDNGNASDPEKAFVKKIEEYEIDEDILTFQGGIPDIIHNHSEFASQFNKAISELSTSDKLNEIIKKYKYTFLRNVDNIDGMSEKYSSILVMDSLNKKAKKDFNIFFQGFEEENMLNFLVVKEIFLRLGEFNTGVKKEWNELSNSIGVVNMVADGRGLYQELNDLAQSGIGLCSKTDKFLQYIALILSIPDGGYNLLEKEIYSKIFYYKSFSYKYEDLFKTLSETDEEISSEFSDDEPARNVDAEDDIPPIIEPGNAEDEHVQYNDIAEDSEKSEFVPALNYTIVGSRSWNTREPYIIRLDSGKLEKDYQDLGITFYYTDAAIDESSINAEIKIATIKYLRGKTKNITEQYAEFINKLIAVHANEMIKFFNIAEDMHKLFIYHLGAFSVYKIVVNILQDEKSGYCYKFAESNKIARYMPFEFIKESVLNWFEKNINVHSLPFDNVHNYDEIRKNVSKTYYSELGRINKVLNRLLKKVKEETKKEIDKYQFFKSKWNKWFGIANIVAYQRFVEKTVF